MEQQTYEIEDLEPEIPKEDLVEVKYENYLFSVRVISQEQVDIQAIELNKFSIFSIKGYIFNQRVSADTLFAALNKSQQEVVNLEISITESPISGKEVVNQLEDSTHTPSEDTPNVKLILNLKVNSEFLNHDIVESIPLKMQHVDRKKVAQMQLDFLQNQIQSLKMKMIQFSRTKLKVTRFIREKSYESYGSTTVASCILPKGKYSFSLNFFGHFPSGFGTVRILVNKKDISCLTQSTFYVSNIALKSFIPLALGCTHTIPKRTEVKLEFKSCDSTKIHVKNLIFSATLISQ